MTLPYIKPPNKYFHPIYIGIASIKRDVILLAFFQFFIYNYIINIFIISAINMLFIFYYSLRGVIYVDEAIANLFKAMGEPTRLKISNTLYTGNVCM
jgi:hypothetical protein